MLDVGGVNHGRNEMIRKMTVFAILLHVFAVNDIMAVDGRCSVVKGRMTIACGPVCVGSHVGRCSR